MCIHRIDIEIDSFLWILLVILGCEARVDEQQIACVVYTKHTLKSFVIFFYATSAESQKKCQP